MLSGHVHTLGNIELTQFCQYTGDKLTMIPLQFIRQKLKHPRICGGLFKKEKSRNQICKFFIGTVVNFSPKRVSFAKESQGNFFWNGGKSGNFDWPEYECEPCRQSWVSSDSLKVCCLHGPCSTEEEILAVSVASWQSNRKFSCSASILNREASAPGKFLKHQIYLAPGNGWSDTLCLKVDQSWKFRSG